MSKPGQLTHGMPPRDPAVDLARDLQQMRRDLNELHGMLVAATNTANSAVISSQVTQVDRLNFDINIGAGTWSLAAFSAVTVPAGFARALVSVFASCGATISSTSGSIGVQPVINYDSGSRTSLASGMPIFTGNSGGVLSVASYFGADLTGLTDGQSLTVGGLTQLASGTATVNTGSVHIASTWLFMR